MNPTIKIDNSPHKPLSFTVKLSQWRCGVFGGNRHGKGLTSLLNEEGFKCCLGFAAEQFGYRGSLLKCVNPSALNEPIEGLTTINYIGRLKHTEFTKKAIRINDNGSTTVQEKMEALQKLGQEHNVTVNFVD